MRKKLLTSRTKRSCVWCTVPLNLDALTLMLMRHDIVGDDGIGDGARAWKLFLERFQRAEGPTIVILVAQIA